ncbi:hypothetical protein RJ640_030080 [Escallonia rubra]|uniref:DNA/RNA-binding domain-containing protein n=1 Tax=Escallonia rubra TaxID=112253 RepID=A0AA88QNE1_9ASTE|nr:hypothetical protein RJ640_030080 [Escallonia rubra]
MRELEALLTLDDAKLEASLECYSHLDSARRRPYRVLHIVSALVFIIQSLTKIPESSDQKEKMDVQPSDSTKLAWSATFVCMGRLVDRCLKSNDLDGCPLLVAVLVFVEWLCGMLDRADTWNTDEKVTSSMFYFFGAFADLLNQLDLKEGKAKSNDHTPLWEDYELKGFAPMAHAHASLDFPSNCKDMVNRDDSNVTRACRIFHSAIKIVERSSGSPKWISYDKLRRKFYAAESNTISDQTEAAVKKSSSFSDTKESSHRTCEATKGYEEDIRRENLSHPCPRGEDLAVEEEEVILFKPLTRYNSAPICTSLLTDDQVLREDTSHQEAPSDESLRRATSLYAAQSLAHNFDATNCRSDRPFKQQEPPPKDSATYPTGPPSLSAWVFNRESANDEREKGSRGLRKQELSPIEEIPSAPLEALSISEATDSFIGSSNVSATVHRSPPPYVAPVPSAPLLPDHAAWYRENSSSFPQRVNEVGISEAEGILGASPVGGFSNWSGTRNPYNFGPAIPSLFDGYPPVVGMSSSEWLQQYKNSQFFQRANNHVRPAHFDPPGTLHGHDASRFDLFDRWGNPLVSNQMVFFENPQLHPGSPPVHNTEEQRRENLFLGYQRPSPYGCRAGTELQAEQPLLLRYLKEREWQLQRESQLRGPTYMGN